MTRRCGRYSTQKTQRGGEVYLSERQDSAKEPPVTDAGPCIRKHLDDRGRTKSFSSQKRSGLSPNKLRVERLIFGRNQRHLSLGSSHYERIGVRGGQGSTTGGKLGDSEGSSGFPITGHLPKKPSLSKAESYSSDTVQIYDGNPTSP